MILWKELKAVFFSTIFAVYYLYFLTVCNKLFIAQVFDYSSIGASLILWWKSLCGAILKNVFFMEKWKYHITYSPVKVKLVTLVNQTLYFRSGHLNICWPDGPDPRQSTHNWVKFFLKDQFYFSAAMFSQDIYKNLILFDQQNNRFPSKKFHHIVLHLGFFFLFCAHV